MPIIYLASPGKVGLLGFEPRYTSLVLCAHGALTAELQANMVAGAGVEPTFTCL